MIIMAKKFLKVREQIQEDLIDLLDSQFGEVEYVDEVKDMACEIINENFKKLLKTK
jgi:hypothetical protein